jgi:hypothetical protein
LAAAWEAAASLACPASRSRQPSCMTNELWIAAARRSPACSARPPRPDPPSPASDDAPPPRIKAWMDRLTVDHAYDPETGFIVATEVITLPPGDRRSPAARRGDPSRGRGRLVVAFATADRCAPCQQYKKTALNDPRVVEALSGPTSSRRTSRSTARPQLAQQYLGSLGIPMTYALRDGERVATLRGQRSADTNSSPGSTSRAQGGGTGPSPARRTNGTRSASSACGPRTAGSPSSGSSGSTRARTASAPTPRAGSSTRASPPITSRRCTSRTAPSASSRPPISRATSRSGTSPRMGA